MIEPTWQQLWDRARAFELECKRRYDASTGHKEKQYDILGMSDAIAEQAILLQEWKAQ